MIRFFRKNPWVVPTEAIFHNLSYVSEWVDQLWTKQFFSIVEVSSLIEANGGPERGWLVNLGLLPYPATSWSHLFSSAMMDGYSAARVASGLAWAFTYRMH